MTTKTFLEKYSPTNLNELVGQNNIKEIIRGYVKSGNIPHLIFTGSPGIGKTTLANIVAKELFGDSWKSNIVSMNASDERGIDVVRGKIKDATKYSPLGGFDFKIIFMDEADFLTEPAQRALRDIVVKHQNITRFIFAVNDLSKIISPLQDRCQIFKFKSLKNEDIYEHLQRINECENIKNINNDNLMFIANLSDGSMRKAVNCLQSLATLDNVNDSIIQELMNVALNDNDIIELLKLVKNENVEVYEKFLFELVYNKSYTPDEIMIGIIDNLIKSNKNNMIPIVVGLAEYQWRMSQGANELLQLRCGLMKLSQTKV